MYHEVSSHIGHCQRRIARSSRNARHGGNIGAGKAQHCAIKAKGSEDRQAYGSQARKARAQDDKALSSRSRLAVWPARHFGLAIRHDESPPAAGLPKSALKEILS